jgi:endonuclease-8
MPEGPEIRIAADKLCKILQGQPAQSVVFAFPHLQSHQADLTGQVITQVESRGKAMLIHFAGGLSIYSHNQLYGRWVTTRAGKEPKTNRQIRMVVATPRGTAWLLSASEIEVLDAPARHSHPYLSKLGPDPLDRSVTADTLMEHWKQTRFSRRAACALLLDQSFLAGVGNYLRSEILYVAGHRPDLRLPPNRQKLASASLELFRQSHQTGGLTNDLRLVQELKDQGVRRSEYRHWVFNRLGKPCRRCGEAIRKDILAGRRLYWCPGCQVDLS